MWLSKCRVFLRDELQILSEMVGEPWRTILVSPQPLMKVLKGIVFTLVLSLPFISIRKIFASLSMQNFYQRDLIQEYLLAKALLAGENLYSPLVELAQRLTPNLPVVVFSHPTPHPPPVALFSLPLALFSYKQAVVIWFALEILCIFLISYLLIGWWGTARDWKRIVLFAVLIMGSEPFVIDIGMGQLSIFLLLLLTLSWQCLRNGDEILGGSFLGLVIALKLMAWPIALYLLFKRRWWAIFAVIMVVVLSNGLMAVLIGVEQFISYYLHVGPTVSAIYQGDAWNVSIWGWGWSFFAGLDSSVASSIKSPSLFEFLSNLAPYASVLCSLLLLIVGLYYAFRVRSFDIAFGVLTCISVLVNPVAWSHYFTWVVIPIVILWRYLYQLRYPHVEFRLTLMITLSLAYCWGVLGGLAHFLIRMPTDTPVMRLVGLFTYLPTYLVLLLMVIVLRMDLKYDDVLCFDGYIDTGDRSGGGQ